MLKSAYYCYTDCYCYCCTRKKEFRHAQVTRPSMSADHRKTIPKTQVMRETRGTAPLEHGKLDAAAASCLFAIALLVIVTCMCEELLSMLWWTHASYRHLAPPFAVGVSVGLSPTTDSPLVYPAFFRSNDALLKFVLSTTLCHLLHVGYGT